MDYRDYYFNNRQYLHDVFVKTDITMLGTVIDFAKMTIRGAFLLNGAAAIAALGMFTEVLLKYPSLGQEFYLVIAYLGLGTFFASLSCGMAYFTQKKYQAANGEYMQSQMCETNIQMIIQQLKDNKYSESNMPSLEKIEVNEMKQAIEDNRKQQKVSVAKSSKYENQGDILCFISVSLIFASYIFFFCALYQAAKTLAMIN